MHKYTFVLVLFAFAAGASGQDETSEEVKALIDSARVYYYLNGEKTLRFSREAFALSEEADDYWGKLNALQLIGEGFYTLGKFDSAMYCFDQALELSVAEKDRPEVANNLVSKGSIASAEGKYSEALDYYMDGIEVMTELADTSDLCDAWLRYGNVFSNQGNHDKAAEAILTAIRFCEWSGDMTDVAYCYANLAVISDKQKAYEQAEEYYGNAIEIFTELEDDFGLGGVYNNLGILYKHMEAYDEAIKAYEESLAIFRRLEFQEGIGACYTNLGILQLAKGLYENATDYARQGLEISLAIANRESEQDNLNTLARAYSNLNQYPEALLYAERSKEIADDLGSVEKQRDVSETYSMIYEGVGDYRAALESYKQFGVYKDSIFNTERSKQIDELRTIYETEKKDREIELLAKNAEIDRIKKTRLWIGLGLAVLIGALLVYNQWQRRRKDKQIHLQQQEIESQKRRNAELENDRLNSELEFKQRELTAKVLQLARKNEFLQTLNSKVEELRDETEGTTKDNVRRLGRMINHDVESETDWDDFLASFREVHKEYLEKLIDQYPDLSKSEIKLSCLMKMNLSSKEMASLLNISAEGIKKARHRLRKKLRLEPDQGIQEFLLSFSP